MSSDPAGLRPISPERVSRILRAEGWQLYGGRPDLYSRWRSSDTDEAITLTLPLNTEMADYSALMEQAISAVMRSQTNAGRLLGLALESTEIPGDAIRFRRETATKSGTLAWPAGEALIVSARQALQASAKTTKSRKSYFGNSNAKLAKAYMNSVLMGQTENTSYVVTAYAPSQEPLFENLDDQQPMLPDMPSEFVGRDVTSSLVGALEATHEAISHYEGSQSSLTGFTDGVRHGISYELVTALQGMLSGSEGADVSVSWEQITGHTDEVREPVIVEFEPRWYPILDRASHELAVTSPSETVTVIGTVTLLDRPRATEPGIVRVEVLSGSPARNLRVRLDPDQYSTAVDAHRGDAGIVITGRQEREGRYYWLYDPRDLRVMDIEQLAGTTLRRR